MRFLLVIILFVSSCNSNNADKAANDPGADSIIISERIDGPANIRETINGKLLFTLNDNVAVEATEPQNKWLKVGLFADLTKEQKSSLLIKKGSRIFVNGNEVGHALEDIEFGHAFENNNGLKGELVGFSSVSNIKPSTIPEHVFATIVNNNPSALTKNLFKQFFKDFRFNDFDGLLPKFKGYEIDENWIEDPSPLLRLWLLFEDDKLHGVFHSRSLKLNTARTINVERGFYYSTFSDEEKMNKDIVDAFNSYINQVD